MPKIVYFDSCGQAEVLKIADKPLNPPQEGEVRIKVKALGLNRAEVLFRQGIYLEKPDFPAHIGYEASGIVDACGPKVTGFKTGEQVSTIPSFSMSKYGVYGEYAIVPANSLARYPDNLNFEEAASIWMQYLTAYGALVELGRMKAGNFVVITAASSSVGYAAIQLCKTFGAISIACTRQENKKQNLLDVGANYVIVTKKEDLPQTVLSITNNHGADICFDAVAGSMLTQLAKAAAYDSTIFEYGALSLETTPFPLMLALEKALTVRGYTLFQINRMPEVQKRACNFIYTNLENKTLKPIIDHVFPLEDIVAAHKYMESNQQKGKIVVTI